MKPHRVEYWLNAKPADPEVFADQVAAVCQVYQQAPSFAQQGGHVISTDEKTGIQGGEHDLCSCVLHMTTFMCSTGSCEVKGAHV